MSSGLAYRSNEGAILAARAEERELAAMGRDARMRRARVGAMLAGGVVLLLAGSALDARFSVRASRPALHCHQVTIRYEDPSTGSPPPPASWRTCEWR